MKINILIYKKKLTAELLSSRIPLLQHSNAVQFQITGPNPIDIYKQSQYYFCKTEHCETTATAHTELCQDYHSRGVFLKYFFL